MLPPTGDAPDYRDRGGTARSIGCPEFGSGNTGSNPVRGTKWPAQSWAGPLVSRRRPFPVEGFPFRRLKAENGPFLEKTAPNTALTPVPLKTPEMEVAKGVQAIGVNPENLRGSISVPQASFNASDAHQKYFSRRQKSQKSTVVGISTGFLTSLMLLTGPSHQKGMRQIGLSSSFDHDQNRGPWPYPRTRPCRPQDGGSRLQHQGCCPAVRHVCLNGPSMEPGCSAAGFLIELGFKE